MQKQEIFAILDALKKVGGGDFKWYGKSHKTSSKDTSEESRKQIQCWLQEWYWSSTGDVRAFVRSPFKPTNNIRIELFTDTFDDKDWLEMCKRKISAMYVLLSKGGDHAIGFRIFEFLFKATV